MRDPDPITGYDFRCDKPLVKSRAIREKCLECQGGSRDRVKNCSIVGCTLWPYRIGRGVCQSENGENIVRRKRTLSPEQRAALKERMKKARAKK